MRIFGPDVRAVDLETANHCEKGCKALDNQMLLRAAYILFLPEYLHVGYSSMFIHYRLTQ